MKNDHYSPIIDQNSFGTITNNKMRYEYCEHHDYVSSMITKNGRPRSYLTHYDSIIFMAITVLMLIINALSITRTAHEER